MEKKTTSNKEEYAYDEPTPADTVITTSEGTFILRMGESPIRIGASE